MGTPLRGADIVMRTLERAGCETVFTLSGNHIMSLFDAAIETRLDLLHVRQEAASVHMADAFGRLTGAPGVAMVTGGPGHANAAAGLMTALGQESPMVLLSGHAATWELGRGGFQELRQADMAAPAAKASWTASSTASLGADLARALRTARSGRPGPVHLSLPSDLLDATVPSDAIAWPETGDFEEPAAPLDAAVADAVLAQSAAAKRPLLIAGPQLANSSGRDLLARLEAATGVPACIMESPRGVKDATLGAFADIARQADLIILLGKALDFTLQFGAAPAFDPGCRWIMLDPEAKILDRARRELGAALIVGVLADTRPTGETLIRRAAALSSVGGAALDRGWQREARAAMDVRPTEWLQRRSSTPGKLHPAEVFRALAPHVAGNADTVLICDGGEFAQWGQSLLAAPPRRLVNGVGGSIGASLPFAIASRVVARDAPIFAVLGDGTFGFHMAEFETAARRNLPFVAVVGTDARWNAEHALQVRDYGPNRTHGCELLPARYDLVAAALGGHGELVEHAADLPGALERAAASGKPACVNVMIESTPAPAAPRPAA